MCGAVTEHHTTTAHHSPPTTHRYSQQRTHRTTQVGSEEGRASTTTDSPSPQLLDDYRYYYTHYHYTQRLRGRGVLQRCLALSGVVCRWRLACPVALPPWLAAACASFALCALYRVLRASAPRPDCPSVNGDDASTPASLLLVCIWWGRGAVSVNGHITQTAPGLVRSPKLSCVEPSQ